MSISAVQIAPENGENRFSYHWLAEKWWFQAVKAS
jgi:hypothetical protein